VSTKRWPSRGARRPGGRNRVDCIGRWSSRACISVHVSPPQWDTGISWRSSGGLAAHDIQDRHYSGAGHQGALDEFVPTVADAIEVVKGRVCLVDGTITPCWSYTGHKELWSRKHATTGFKAKLVSLLDGTPVSISEPLPGNTHDKPAFDETPVAEIVRNSGGGIDDKGYQGTSLATPRKTPKG
jgi:hypothetical protein